jgi:hypothetical protein
MPELSASGTGVPPVISSSFHAQGKRAPCVTFLDLPLGQDVPATFSQSNPFPILKSSLDWVIKDVPDRMTKVWLHRGLDGRKILPARIHLNVATTCWLPLR